MLALGDRTSDRPRLTSLPLSLLYTRVEDFAMASFELLRTVTDVVRMVVFLIYFSSGVPDNPSEFFRDRQSHLDVRGVLVVGLVQEEGIPEALVISAAVSKEASWITSQ
jgi:hypothetical protein